MPLHPAITAIASLGALALRPEVQLANDSIEVGLPPKELLEVFRARFADSPEDIIAIEENQLVRRFAGSEGPFSFKTVEVVRYEDQAVTFEHLSGPFAECNERFDMVATPTGSMLTHSGSFRLRGGLFTVPLAFGPVKKAFETHVRGHFETLASEYPPALASSEQAATPQPAVTG